MRTHLTWSIEKEDNVCPQCESKTILIIAPANWSVDSEPYGDEDDESVGDKFIDGVDLLDEITGHYCPNCRNLCSLSLNTHSS